jgi:hypothetical protein
MLCMFLPSADVVRAMVVAGKLVGLQRKLLQKPTTFQGDTYCVPRALGSLLPALFSATKMKALKAKCNERGSLDGHIKLSVFRDILMDKTVSAMLEMEVEQCELLNHSLGRILLMREGVALISNGRGHTVGLACASRILVDATVQHPIELRGGASQLARHLSCHSHDRVNVLYLVAKACNRKPQP